MTSPSSLRKLSIFPKPDTWHLFPFFGYSRGINGIMVDVRDLDGGLHRVSRIWVANTIPSRNWLQVTADSPADVTRNRRVNFDDIFANNAWWANVFGSPALESITPPLRLPRTFNAVFSDDLHGNFTTRLKTNSRMTMPRMTLSRFTGRGWNTSSGGR